MEVKFLPNLFRRRDDRNSATAHAISGSVAATSGMYGSVFSYRPNMWDVQRSIDEALEKVIWVFRCVDAIASNQSKLTIVARKGDPFEGKIVNIPHIHKLLNQRPNRYETAQDFRYRLSAQALLSHRGVFIEVVKSEAGIPVELHLLPPHLVEPIPDPKRFVAGYRLMNQVAMEEVILPPDRVIWIRLKPHPVDPYSQLTPLTSAGLAVETDWLARVYNRQFLLNDGRPGLLIAIRGNMNPTDMREVKDRFSGGPYGAGRSTVINADDAVVQDLGASPRDMQWLDAIRGSKDDILLAFGTPESILGNASGRTYDNADAEKENWWEETEQPHCQAIGRGLDPLTGNVEDDICISFKWEEVDVLQRRKRMRHEKLLEEWKAGARTLDEYLKEVGREPWDHPLTRALILPNGMIVPRDEGDAEAINALPRVSMPQPGMELSEQARMGAIEGTRLGQRNFENIVAARALELSRINRQISTEAAERWNFRDRNRKQQFLEELEQKVAELEQQFDTEDVVDGEVVEYHEAIHPYEADRITAESLFEGVLDAWSETQANVIPGRLDHVKIRKFTRHWEGEGAGTKALDPRYAVETDRWINDINGVMERTMKRVGMDMMRKTAAEMDSSGIVRVMHAIGRGNPSGRTPLARVYGSRADAEKALSELIRPLSDVVAAAARKQSDRVAERIAQLDADGASLTTIKKEIREMIGRRSKWRSDLARQITTSLMEAVRHHTYMKAGERLIQKTWNTMQDERVRHSHMKVDGTSRPITKRFRVGKAWMMFPGDPAGGPEETINCRCYLDYDISEKGADLYDELAY